ncbi:MAG TPA: hypothetical protein VKP30_08185, partial [Polyangiaceae bacterium]|nr:hypothetical protein [Polyangiaceae bacterium]
RAGNPEVALRNAERALRLSPEEPRLSELAIRACLRAGRHSDALRYAWSHVAIYPEDTRGWYVLSEVLGPKSALYSQVLRRATERIPMAIAYSLPRAEQGVRLSERLDRTAQAELELDAALAASDTRATHRAARQLGLSTLELMDRALKVGAFEFARSQAQLAGSLLPDDPRIWQVRLVLADLAGDDAEFELLLAHPPQLPTSASADWTELNQLIDRRAGARLHPASAKVSR